LDSLKALGERAAVLSGYAQHQPFVTQILCGHTETVIIYFDCGQFFGSSVNANVTGCSIRVKRIFNELDQRLICIWNERLSQMMKDAW
jgi:hypothetical protein